MAQLYKTVAKLLGIFPTPKVLISGFKNTGEKFSIAFINKLSAKKCKTLCYDTD